MLRSAKILERMVNLNTHDEIAQDFRFWEDQSDEYKEAEGSLLPLWRFSFEPARDLEVSYIDFRATMHPYVQIHTYR